MYYPVGIGIGPVRQPGAGCHGYAGPAHSCNGGLARQRRLVRDRGRWGGGPRSETKLYAEPRPFAREVAETLVRRHVFEPFGAVAGGEPNAKLYTAEVFRSSIELMVPFLFDRRDRAIETPSVLGGRHCQLALQSGLSALFSRITARNFVMLEQIAADTVRRRSIAALAGMEQTVRFSEGPVRLQTTVTHLDGTFAAITDIPQPGPGPTGPDPQQIATIQTFATELLEIGQEALSEDVSPKRAGRVAGKPPADSCRRVTLLDWTDPGSVSAGVDLIGSGLFVPDQQALRDLSDIHLDLRVDRAEICSGGCPGRSRHYRCPANDRNWRRPRQAPPASKPLPGPRLRRPSQRSGRSKI